MRRRSLYAAVEALAIRICTIDDTPPDGHHRALRTLRRERPESI